MAITKGHAGRPALSAKAVSIAAAAALAAIAFTSPIADAAPASASRTATIHKTGPLQLDTSANWAAVKRAAANGYRLSAKLDASCGALGGR